MTSRAAITGVGLTHFGELPGSSWLSLHIEAAQAALTDAGLDRSDVDGIICAYSMTSPHPMLASAFAEAMGMNTALCFAMQAGGATAALMVMNAARLVETGRYRNILLVTGDNRLSGMSRDGAVAGLADFGHAIHERPYGFSIPGAYGIVAQRYLHDTKLDERGLAAVAVSARTNAGRHPKAHKRDPITIEDVLSSRIIAAPLKLLDCCLVSDGAAAVVVSATDSATRTSHGAVPVLGAGQGQTHEHLVFAPSLSQFGCAASAALAFHEAAVTPADVHVAEIYDSFTITLLVELESMGFFPKGHASAAAINGDLDIDGALPCNTHGGLLSFGHSGAAGGMTHVVEAVEQLRGTAAGRQVPDAKIAFVHGDGGVFSLHCSLLLGEAR
ncbi:MAG: hypothetical protein JWO15_1394 [Sphingomonadales bacterium]|nr:hypothetical protein [Sphingomonadales bacterium]